MDFFFNPKGIALIGATPNPLKGGHAILQNLLKGFKGKIHPVNPRYEEILGIPCHKTIADVPDPVDLAIIFIPGKMVPQIIESCAKRGIKGVIIESSGFAESGKEGQQVQKDLTNFARKEGVRLWGPNCMGLVDAVNKNVFSFVSPELWEELIPGDVSLIVQSGMLSGGFLIDCMSHGTMGVSKVCSIGNKMDVDECEILEYMLTDPHTKVIGLYLESITHGRRFMEICRRATKPIVLLKGGKSAMGAKAAMGHTASMAGNGAVIRDAMAQAGVMEATDFHQMMDLCRSLAAYPDIKPTPKGRVAILTYSGGAGIISSDFMENGPIEPAVLSRQSKERLKTIFPQWMPPSNPIDLWPAVEQHGAEKAYGLAIDAACDDPGVDAIFIHAFAGGFRLSLDLDKMSQKAKKMGKPVFCWLIGRQDEARIVQLESHSKGIPVFRELHRAVECMGAVFAHGNRTISVKSEPDNRNDTMAHDTIKVSLKKGKTALDEHLSKTILDACNIPVTKEIIVADEASACQMATQTLKFPVVMKGLLPGEVHKTEAGLVKLNIESRDQVKTAFKDLTQAMDGKGEILIQQQIKGDLELIAGVVKDPQFGVCVMVGLGGVMAEILDDAVFGVAPLSHSDALALMGRLKHQKLLDGFRGAKGVDRDVLAKILCALGDLALAYPQINEIDVNPLIISKGNPIAVDASIIQEQ
ncbi:acetyltransferase [Desulfocicer vacuolatum DSM 3385]|uniref:Acetyltransferase n=1 Tax=Desulfocicer vacuolatum DSM 3385 TaxID=1121400 RepID=A0A1W2ECR2_9BACT|nr:acetate--CoA ligase family protein [Desulfocicer vacuolatum]SMD07540.1 acetyltransferase [Desulfocicer vacuolatum DSM 3385]